MDKLNLIACESLEALAKRFNEELEKGRGIVFHNNNGLYVRDPNGRPYVYVFGYTEWPGDESDAPEMRPFSLMYGFSGPIIEHEPDFFKMSRKGDLSFSDNEEIPENKLICGSRTKPFGIGRLHTVGPHLDSPEYGPVSGILTQTKFGGVLSFEYIDRIYWKKE